MENYDTWINFNGAENVLFVYSLDLKLQGEGDFFGDKLFKMREGRQNLDTMELYQCLMEINAHFRSVVLYRI